MSTNNDETIFRALALSTRIIDHKERKEHREKLLFEFSAFFCGYYLFLLFVSVHR